MKLLRTIVSAIILMGGALPAVAQTASSDTLRTQHSWVAFGPSTLNWAGADGLIAPTGLPTVNSQPWLLGLGTTLRYGRAALGFETFGTWRRSENDAGRSHAAAIGFRLLAGPELGNREFLLTPMVGISALAAWQRYTAELPTGLPAGQLAPANEFSLNSNLLWQIPIVLDIAVAPRRAKGGTLGLRAGYAIGLNDPRWEQAPGQRLEGVSGLGRSFWFVQLTLGNIWKARTANPANDYHN